jgi:hypothetical protein
MKIEVVIGLDMETDIGSWTPFYEGLVHGTPRVLETLSRRGVEATFFFTGQAARGHPEIVRDVAAAGHEVGSHSIYHETVGDELFPLPGIYPLLPEEIPGRLRTATKMVEDALGEKLVSFRCPRLFGSTTVTNTLEELGYAADASYPMYYYKERLLPYHPSREDWTQEGDLRLVEIPNFADMSMESSDEYGRDRDQWPIFRSESAEALLGHIRGFLDFVSQRHDRACLCFYFHPWEFWPMPQGPVHVSEGSVQVDGYIVKNCGDYALEQFGRTIDALGQMGAEFLTARALAERY